MALDASSERPRASTVSWRGKVLPSLKRWRERVSSSLRTENSKILWLNVLLTLFTLWLVYYAIDQARLTRLATEYQNAIALIDQTTQIAEDVLKEPNLEAVLKLNVVDKASVQQVSRSLESYQTLIFKASILQENGLLPSEFWKAFKADFCRMYAYPFVQAWWAKQKDRKPYADLSEQYRNIAYQCSN
jgi:hypothetical protein